MSTGISIFNARNRSKIRKNCCTPDFFLLLGGGLEPRFRVLFSAVFHGVPSEGAIRVENRGFWRKQNCCKSTYTVCLCFNQHSLPSAEMIAFVSRSFSDLGKTRSERNTREKATEKPGYRNRSRLFSLLNRTQASVVHRCFVGLRLLSYEDLCRQAIGKSDPEWPLPPQSPRRRAKTSGQRREGFLLP